MSGQVIWITGLSGAGKTTLARELILRLQKKQFSPILLDGDLLRNILVSDNLEQQSYSRNSRINLGLRYGLLCQALSAQGLVVVVATISMFSEIFSWNRENIKNCEFHLHCLFFVKIQNNIGKLVTSFVPE